MSDIILKINEEDGTVSVQIPEPITISIERTPKKNESDAEEEKHEMVDRTLPRIVRVRELAELTGVSEVLIRQLIAQGRVDGYKAGNRFYIFYDRFIEKLNAGEYIDEK